jgi:hypothetical protein
MAYLSVVIILIIGCSIIKYFHFRLEKQAEEFYLYSYVSEDSDEEYENFMDLMNIQTPS